AASLRSLECHEGNTMPLSRTVGTRCRGVGLMVGKAAGQRVDLPVATDIVIPGTGSFTFTRRVPLPKAAVEGFLMTCVHGVIDEVRPLLRIRFAIVQFVWSVFSVDEDPPTVGDHSAQTVLRG